MSWKPSAKSSEHLRAKLDDEFETVAKPQGLRRSSDARRAAEPAAAPDEWQRTSEQRVAPARAGPGRIARAPATMCGTMMERTAIGRAATGRRAVRRPMAASPSARGRR